MLLDDIQSEPEQGSCSGDSSPTHTPTSPTRTSNNIHLWQFVKELLNDPQLHSGEKIFKKMSQKYVLNFSGLLI